VHLGDVVLIDSATGIPPITSIREMPVVDVFSTTPVFADHETLFPDPDPYDSMQVDLEL